MSRLSLGVMIVALLGLGATSALAANARRVSFPNPGVLNGKSIPAGHFKVTWESHSPTATVTLVDDRTVLVTAQATLEDRGKAFSENAVVYDTQANGTLAIREIRLAGMSQALVFTP